MAVSINKLSYKKVECMYGCIFQSKIEYASRQGLQVLPLSAMCGVSKLKLLIDFAKVDL